MMMVIFLALLTTQIAAQTLPNNDFELWNDEASIPTPESWNTPNNYTMLGVGSPSVVDKSTDAYSGMYSVRLETKMIDFTVMKVPVPGAITLADFSIDITNQTLVYFGGYFLQQNVQKLTGMYKYQGVGNDSASILMYNYSNRDGESFDTIGYGYKYLRDATEWTPFEVKMRYINSHVPDTFNVLFMSTTDEGVTDPAHAGSVLYIDSLVIYTNTGILNLWEKPIALHVFPNPATDKIRFEAEEAVKGRQLIISDASGKIILKKEFQNKIINLPVFGFPAGMYTYSVTEGRRIVNSGSFIKK